jgi:AAA+ superfamily predicted ATPase
MLFSELAASSTHIRGCASQVEFGLPDLESRTQIFQIHTRTMNVERNIRFELLARLCPNSTGADIRSVCTEAGMFAIRNRCAPTATHVRKAFVCSISLAGVWSEATCWQGLISIC